MENRYNDEKLGMLSTSICNYARNGDLDHFLDSSIELEERLLTLGVDYDDIERTISSVNRVAGDLVLSKILGGMLNGA